MEMGVMGEMGEIKGCNGNYGFTGAIAFPQK